jgi:hypothetical protein
MTRALKKQYQKYPFCTSPISGVRLSQGGQTPSCFVTDIRISGLTGCAARRIAS